MKRISEQNENDASLGRKVLSWISYAKRPLTVSEMQHAVKVKTSSTGIEERDLISENILVSVCAGIVTVDRGTNIIRLVHYTTQDYLSRTLLDAKQEIGNACLTYLLFNDFKDGYCSTDEALESLLNQNPLLDYAARHWAHHVCTLTEPVTEVALKFLADTSRTTLSFQVMNIGPYHYPNYSQGYSKRVSGLHLCAYFGMHSIVTKMLEIQSNRENVDIKDSNHQTPLSWAAGNGHEAVVQLLLDRKAEIESKDSHYGRIPLS
jgi:Ankyrin repeats (3 copies)